jgi:hypothetical protein
METAVLRLGLAGFGTGEQDAIRKVAAGFRGAEWLCGGPDGADAWLVNCARASWTGKQMRVTCTDAAGRATPVLMDSTSRPIAFTGAVAAQIPAPSPLLFELSRPDSLLAVLRQLDRKLHAAKTCFWTAAHILAHHATIGKALFELRAGAELLAVVDMKGDVAVSPVATEGSFEHAAWKHRARKTVTVPDHFRRCPLSQLMWQYTTRTRQDLLPERYRDGSIFFRRPPRVDPELITDTHLSITRQLALGPTSLRELQAALGIDERIAARALADLYFVGSITSNPERAWQRSVRGALWSSRPTALDAGEPTPIYKGVRPDAPHSTAPLL